MGYHVMLDLETLGTTPFDIVWAIGAVAFDSSNDSLPYAQFYELISIEDSRRLGFCTDDKTVAWWESQADRAELEKASQPDELLNRGVVSVLNHFAKWLENFPEPMIWGNGVTFDNTLLKAYYEHMGMEVPWNFRKDMCFRTLKNIFPIYKPATENPCPHHALADAQYQALWLERIIKEAKLDL